MTNFTWASGGRPLHFSYSASHAVRAGFVEHDDVVFDDPDNSSRNAMVEALAFGRGRALNSVRADRTEIGDGLRYRSHSETTADGIHRIEIVQAHFDGTVEATTTIDRHDGVDAWRATTALRNTSDDSIGLQMVTSIKLSGLTGLLGDHHDLRLWSARNEWCAENRWSAFDLAGAHGLPNIHPSLHGQAGRGMIERSSHSTWSSGEYVPTAVLEGLTTGTALAWEVENNGPWRWELQDQYSPTDMFTLALMGPNDLEHHWTHTIAPGESFTSTPSSFAVGGTGVDGAIAVLNGHRRKTLSPGSASRKRPLIFNDYMNALMGDPTREKLLPLIDRAAELKAQYFCIDAGWYDDGGNWWPSVGAWQPSTVRFGEGGLVGVLEYIRSKGMKPGLWVEPEVIGVRSPMASSLPDECFMTRGGKRIEEQERYFLDLRSSAAREYLDSVFERLIGEYGAEYFKWDYNVTPGAGPDSAAQSPGGGLLEHTRALLAWTDKLRARYPNVEFEACSSGAQRMDQATLRRFDLQSTSDQQDFRLYPTIAASAPMALPLEYAGNWAYPQHEMSDDEIAFNLVTGLSGRLYLSGNVDKLSQRQAAIVAEATRLYPEIIAHHARADAAWPTGLPAWTDPFVSLASITAESTLTFAWNREDGGTDVSLSFPHLKGKQVVVEQLYPAKAQAWPSTWDAGSGVLKIDLRNLGLSGRILRLTQK